MVLAGFLNTGFTKLYARPALLSLYALTSSLFILSPILNSLSLSFVGPRSPSFLFRQMEYIYLLNPSFF